MMQQPCQAPVTHFPDSAFELLLVEKSLLNCLHKVLDEFSRVPSCLCAILHTSRDSDGLSVYLKVITWSHYDGL